MQTQFKQYIETFLVSDENIEKEVQHLKYIPFSTSPPVGEHLDLNSHMELVGHSIVRALCLSLSGTNVYKETEMSSVPKFFISVH